jgi:hypothetical protein
MCNGGAVMDAFKKDAKTGFLSGGAYTAHSVNMQGNKALLAESREKGILPPSKVTVDPAAERAAAEAAATQQANARIAFQRKAMRDNSLLTGGGQAAAGAGRSTLGVG